MAKQKNRRCDIPERRIESLVLEEGYGAICIVGSAFDCILYFLGQPHAVNWSDCEGSVAQHLYRAGSRRYKADLQSIRDVVAHGMSESTRIENQITPLLKLFCAGKYSLINYSSEEWAFTDEDLKQSVHYYPHLDTYVPTRSIRSLNANTAGAYRGRIKKGYRPLVVTTSVEEGSCEFVLDGHHKLMGYRQAGVAPNVLNVQKSRSHVPLSEGEAAFHGSADGRELEVYRKVKVEHDGA